MKFFLNISMFCLILFVIENNQATLTDEKKKDFLSALSSENIYEKKAFLSPLSSDDKNKQIEYFEKELEKAHHQLQLQLEKAFESYSASISCKDFIILVNLQNQISFFKLMIAHLGN